MTSSVKMSAREEEEVLLDRCKAASLGELSLAVEPREANVFRVAAMVLGEPFREASRRLSEISTAYFSTHPDELLPPSVVVSRGWVVSFSRLRERLEARLS